jgi:cytochrome c peroxidase
MGASQLGTQLSPDEVSKITAFLDGLTGDQPKVTYPELPPNVGSTPAATTLIGFSVPLRGAVL